MSYAIPLPLHPDMNRYRTLAKDLQSASAAGDPAAIVKWAKDWQPTEAEQIEKHWRADGSIDAQLFIAREHGFSTWTEFAGHVEALSQDGSPVSQFEAAVDAIIAGNVQTLKRLLAKNPSLVRMRSTRDHRSTLLHYVSANGVEDFRQITPPNSVDIAALLLEAGTD